MPSCSILEAQHRLEPPGRSPQPGPPQPPQEAAQHALGELHDGMPARHLVRVWVRVRVTVGVRVRVS